MNTLLLFCAIVSPTERYIASHPMEEIKYSMRLELATLEQKPIFDKAVKMEQDGFCAYFAASADYRTYQDLIRLIFEDKLGVNIPQEFHFLAVPLYPKRTLHTLQDVHEAYFVQKPKAQKLLEQLLPVQPALYANHNRRGFSPAKSFARGTPHPYLDDLNWLLKTLEIDPGLIQQARQITKKHFPTEDRVLLQIFDTSPDPYACIDSFAYPASCSGIPCKNEALSDYLCENTNALGVQYFLLLNDKSILNPDGPIKIKRYTKIQPSSLKAYEEEIRALVQSCACNPVACEEYKNQLQTIWRSS